ncbi:polysaccharide deacetylase family protein [Fictibacillus iocasae]|uniref:Polysaccharide deacetylase family protein n=1 Tax=Fictibacillus iocasae TaxID=2715437 RepID=A0ABW2NPA2_9BACL
MRHLLIKCAVAAGFFTVLGAIGFGFLFAVDEYNLLALENKEIFPPDESLPLGGCVSGSDREIRSFPTGPHASAVPILTYHRIVDQQDLGSTHMIKGKRNLMVVTKQEFATQMNHLKEEGYTSLSLKEVYHFLEQGLKVPEKSVVLTFDDGYKDNYIEAYPILKKYRFHAANFIITSKITKRVADYTPEYVQYFSIQEMQRSCDVFEFQSHSFDYHKRGKDVTNKRMSYLVTKSEKEIVRDTNTSIFQLGGEKLAFAYPYGEYTVKSMDALRKTGLTMAFTTENKKARPGDHIYEIPRYQILSTTTFEEFKEMIK